MTVLLLGKSRLNSYIFSLLNASSVDVEAVSCRSLLQGHQLYSNPDIIIDSLDPPSSTFDNYSELCCLIKNLRRRISRDFSDKLYYYISSSNLYDLSYSTIDEDSDLSTNQSSSYLQNKLHSESLIAQLFPRSSILRLCSMWHDVDCDNDKSFFSDLISARKRLLTLPLREDDDQIISFMHYSEAARKIVCLVMNYSLYPVLNITEQRWTSRALLKCPGSLDLTSQTLYGRRIVSKYTLKHLPPMELPQ